MKKIIISICSIVLLLLSTLTFSSAANAIPPVFYSGGDGSIDNPYLIENCNQIIFIANNLEANYKLISDVDCTTYGFEITSIEPADIGYDFPIGSEAELFSGTFDGDNHTISNLTVEQDGESQTAMFAIIDTNGVVKNLTLENVNIASNYIYSGALAGSSSGTISNVHTSGTITGGTVAGGLIGNNIGTITDSSSSVDILAGYDVNGGLVGQNQGTISKSFATGDVLAGESTGGFVGGNYGTIDQSYATGNVIGSFTDVGGFVGALVGGTITNSYNRGNATAANHVGAFGGTAYDGSTIINSYTTGIASLSPSGNPEPVSDNFITIPDIGINNETFTSLFFDETVAGIVANSTPSQGVTSSILKTQKPFIDLGWDFETIWGISASVNDGYPTFLYALPAEDKDSDGHSGIEENAAPNNGDANQDGVLDSKQSNVTSFPSPTTGKYLSIQTDYGVQLSGAEVDRDVETKYSKDANVKGVQTQRYAITFPTSFTLTNVTTPSVKITLYFYDEANRLIYLRKIDKNTGAISNIASSTLEAMLIDGHSVMKATYDIADNGPLDNNSAIGTISDPVGLVEFLVGAPSTGLGGSANN